MKLKNLALTAMFAALTMVLAPLSLVLPVTVIPFSLSLIPVFLTGALLPKSYACYAQVIYLLLGTVGLPVFSQFRSGPGVLFGPTGGFLIAYPLMALLIAFILEKSPSKNFLFLSLAMASALVLCYLCGSLWYTVTGHVSWLQAISVTVLPFIPFDLIKAFACAGIAFAINKALLKSKLLPFV